MCIQNNFAVARGADLTAFRIFNAVYITYHRSLYLAVFKGKIGVSHLAVFKHQTLAVTEGLSTDYLTSDKVKVFRIPAKIFPLHYAIDNGNVL